MIPQTRPSMFGLVWRGWFAGLLVIMLPLWLLATIAALVTGERGAVQMLGGIVLLPLIAAGQGVLVGGLVVLGLKVWPRKATQ